MRDYVAILETSFRGAHAPANLTLGAHALLSRSGVRPKTAASGGRLWDGTPFLPLSFSCASSLLPGSTPPYSLRSTFRVAALTAEKRLPVGDFPNRFFKF